MESSLVEQQLAATARVRQKLMQWSDDDEEHSVPRKAAHVSEEEEEEEEEEEQQEHESSPESSPVRNRKRGSIAACLDSDDEDIPLPAVKETHRKLSPPPTKRKISSSSSPGVPASSIPSSSSSPSARRVFFSPPPAPVAPPSSVPAGATMQSAIQPGCTQLSSCKRRFLAYNMLGSISSCESDGFSHVEVDFHDTSRGLRVPSMTDYFGFTMAAMNDKGSIFANPQKGEKNPSTLLYRPFNSWTNNSEWSMRFPVEEEVKAVAIGNGWAAAATSLHFLRVYSEAGLQTFVMSLSGPVVALAGYEHQLAVVIHASNPLASGDQILEFLALDMRKKRQTQAGRLPLSPGATLTWLGFSEAGCLSTYDSEAWLLDPLPRSNHTQMGVLRVYSSEFNGCWVPLFRASEERKGTDVNFWMVGLNSTQVFCVVCKAPSVEPQVLPKPVLGIFSTSVPVIHSDLGADDLENAYLRGILQLTQAHTKAVEAAVAGFDDEDEEESLLKMEVEVDRCLLRLIAAACKGDKLAKALELSTQLSLQKSLEGAIKVVNAMRLPSLAERLSLILEERITRERLEAGANRHKGDLVSSSMASPVTTHAPFLRGPKTQGQQSQPNYSPVADAHIQVPDRAAELASSPVDITSTAHPFKPALSKAHKRVTADAMEPDLKVPLEVGNTGDDPLTNSSKKSMAPSGVVNAYGKLKPSNPFAKPVIAPMRHDTEGSEKSDSILLSLKKIQHGAIEVQAQRKTSSTPVK